MNNNNNLPPLSDTEAYAQANNLSPIFELDITPYFTKYNPAQIQKVFGISQALIIEGHTDSADVRFFNKEENNTLTELEAPKVIKFLPYLTQAHQSEVLEYMNRFLEPVVMVEIIKGIQQKALAQSQTPAKQSQAYAQELLKSRSFEDTSKIESANATAPVLIVAALDAEASQVYPFIYKADYTLISQTDIQNKKTKEVASKNLSNIDHVYRNQPDLIKALEQTKVVLDKTALDLGIPVNAEVSVLAAPPIEYVGSFDKATQDMDIIDISARPDTTHAFILKLGSSTRYFFNETEYNKKDFYETMKNTPQLTGLATQFLSHEEKVSLSSKIKASQASGVSEGTQPVNKI